MSTSTMTLPSQTKSMESMLQEARLINSDIGRHSVKCNFSSRLSGRFYQNSSLERNTARKSKLVEMQARKRRLERELRMEEQRVELLEARLNETESCREDAHELIVVIKRGVVAFQTCVRRNQAVARYVVMNHQARMRVVVAIFIQSRYRGWKGRLLVQSIREEMRHQMINQSAIVIQTQFRRMVQRRQYIELLCRNRMMSNQSASAIQAMLRGKMTRKMYISELARRESAAKNIQRVFRGKLGRDEYNRIRQLWLDKQKKPKRVPLHMRRYSTYGNRSPRKMPKKFVLTRRRSSVEDMSSVLKLKMSNEHDENGSVATTLTSLTHATDRSSRRRIAPGAKMSDSTNRASKPSWPSTHRVLGSVSKQNVRDEAKTKPLANSSVASETNSSHNSHGAATTTKPVTQQKAQTRKSTAESRKSLRSGASKELGSVPTFVSGNLTKDHSLQENESDTVPTYISSNPADVCNQHSDDQNTSVTVAQNNPIDQKAPPREKMRTPLIISREASLIVEEVLGKTIITHSINTSSFDDEFSEQEDDLE
ncbi:hypothetical protein ACHAWO_003803 [Cyclotella atomus]|uniref:Uncharacterized protein n=1 Tax=Cyclotella atomus TaxID=382360 RepID=A0ABD3NGY4_9STRA